jgi:hypothetical protein
VAAASGVRVSAPDQAGGLTFSHITSQIFIARVFQEYRTFDDEMDYKVTVHHLVTREAVAL